MILCSQVALTTGLTLVAAFLVIGNAEIYQLTEGFSYAGAPYATVTARTIAQCSIRCTAMTTGDCDGFQFLPDGACLLYLEDPPPVCSAGPEEPTTTTEQATLTVSGSDQPATYRKKRNNTGHSGDSTDACVCPNGFMKCGGRCYHAKLTLYNYTAAEQYCASMGGILATPRSAPENTCAKDVAAAISGSSNAGFWLGYRNNTATSFVGADGGGGMSCTNWSTYGEPHLADDDNCVVLGAVDGLWRDYTCQRSWTPLCQAHN